MAPSIVQLSEYVSTGTFSFQIVRLGRKDMKILTTDSETTWLTIISYVTKLCSDSSDAVLIDTLTRLDDLALVIIKTCWDKPGTCLLKEMEFFDLFKNSFIPEVEKFFEVPRHQKPEDNEVLAGFIHFLLQILTSEGDRIKDGARYAPLQKELTFLLTFLGDVPFLFVEIEEVGKILKEFEAVANEAGGFIYYCVLADSSEKGNGFQERMSSLLEKIELLNEKVKAHCINFENYLCGSVTDPKRSTSVPVDSFFTVDTLLEDLESLESHHHQVELIDDHVMNQIAELQKQLISTRSFLQDIVKLEDTNNEELESCLIHITNVAYEAQYLINSFVVGNVPVWFLTLRLQHIIHKFEEEGFEEIKKKIHGTQSAKQLIAEVLLPTVSNSIHKVDDVVVGFESEMEKIMDELTGEPRNLQIISICGMPGIGKTTLAKTLYTHPTITCHFDRRSWCVVSQTYNRSKVLVEILMSLRSTLDKDKILNMDVKSLGLDIYQSLKGRRYLIVIDDIWNSDVWDDLRRHFPEDRNGSRIIFTTRNRETSPTGIFHMVSFLSEDQCWELLEKKVFCGKPCPPHFHDIGKRIAACCKGLPLAAVVVAGILANMEKKRDLWKTVEESLYSYISDDPSSNYMKILELSYQHLSCPLKSCFLYLGAFPEDTKIPVKKIKLLWIVEGFIQEEKEKSLEEVAEKYLQDLIGRSLLLVGESNSIGGIKSCSIHDLMRDMCMKLAEEENFMKIIDDQSSVYQKHRRLCIHSESLAYSKPFGLHCRSFIGHLSDPTFSFSQTKLVRILDLASTIQLEGIHLFVHLRYLVVNRMPKPIEALANLVNLKVLRIYGRSRRVYIPSTILEMEKLTHLHLEKDAMFEDNCDTSHSNKLESLSYICILNHNDGDILKCSPHLRKLKCLCATSFFPDLSSFSELETLNMNFSSSIFYDVDCKMVSFPLKIKKLTLSGIGLPWGEMSIIGRLPNLCVLKLLDQAFEGEIWETREDEFQELKLLKLEGLNVEEWISSGEHFPKLEHLVLSKCKKLQYIPQELGDIPTLQMIMVNDCSDGAWLSAQEIEEEQRENGNEELKVIISNCWNYTKKKLVERIKRLNLWENSWNA